MNKKIQHLISLSLVIMTLSCSQKSESFTVKFYYNELLIGQTTVKKGNLATPPIPPDEIPHKDYEVWDHWYESLDYERTFNFKRPIFNDTNIYARFVSMYEGNDGYQYTIPSNERDYWYDTKLEIPFGINYHQSNLLETIKIGDIIYEDTGGFGITGHVAFVEGIFYSEVYKQYYIRVIEAASMGVVRSIITPSRFMSKEGSIYRLAEENPLAVNAALDFTKSQLGKPYQIALWKNPSPTNANWYCSELIWAAFYHQGILLDLDDNENLGSVIFPKEMIQSNALNLVSLP